LTNVIDEHRLTPDKIYNVDETNIESNPKSQSKILALKGHSPGGVLSSAQKCDSVTAEK
jgi:hypothetical protein